MADQHDRLFKDLLTNRKFALCFLKQYLPMELAELVNWNSVKLNSANVEHVRQQHKTNHKQKETSDLAFHFSFKDGRHGACFVHIEFQTTDDKTIIVRTRHYQTSYLLDFIKRNKKNKKLPLVVSIIYYANKKPFSHSLDIYDHFENSELAREHAFTTQFIDLSKLTDKELLDHGHIAGLECILKYVAEKNVDARLDIISHAIKSYDSFARKTLIRYLAHHSGLENQVLSDKIINNQPTLENDMKSAAQQWIDEGIEKGVLLGEQKGIEKGIKRGVEQGVEKVARNMFSEGDSIEKIARVTGLTNSALRAIQSGKAFH